MSEERTRLEGKEKKGRPSPRFFSTEGGGGRVMRKYRGRRKSYSWGDEGRYEKIPDRDADSSTW